MVQGADGFELPAAFWSALRASLSSAFWAKRDLRLFIEDHFHDLPAVVDIAHSDERKVVIAEEVIKALRTNQGEAGAATLDAARLLAGRTDFPSLVPHDLDGSLTHAATAASTGLQSVIDQLDQGTATRRAPSAPPLVTALPPPLVVPSVGSSPIRHELRDRYRELEADETLRRQDRGKQFEEWLHAVFEEAGLQPSGSIDVAGEQLDDAFVLDYNHWVVEAKWHTKRMEPRELDVFDGKLSRRPPGTVGLFVSVSGFTENATELNSRRGRTLVLMHGPDLELLASGRIGIVDMLRFKRRTLAESGLALAEVPPL